MARTRSPSPYGHGRSRHSHHSSKRRRYDDDDGRDDDGSYASSRRDRDRDYYGSPSSSSRRDDRRERDDYDSRGGRDAGRDRGGSSHRADEGRRADERRERRRRDWDDDGGADRGSGRREYTERERERETTSSSSREVGGPTSASLSARGVSSSSSAAPVAAPNASSAASASAAAAEESEKQRLKREKIERWKKEREAKAAAAAAAAQGKGKEASASPAPASPKPLQRAPVKQDAKPTLSIAGTGAGAVSRAQQAAQQISTRITDDRPRVTTSTLKPNPSLPAKPTFSFAGNTNAAGARSKANAFGGAAQDDDDGAAGLAMHRFEDAGEIDMTIGVAGEGDADDTEDLEGGAVYKLREGETGRDADDEKMDVDVKPSVVDAVPDAKFNKREEPQDDEDDLEAYMNSISAEVKRVDDADRMKLGGGKADKKPSVAADANGLLDEDGDEGEASDDDDPDKTGLSTEEILALAAKNVKKRGRELPVVDHSKVDYEPFRKSFYHPPPEVEAMSQEEAGALREDLDNIKIRGADPPKPVTKWSYFGLPAVCNDVIRSLEYHTPTAIQAQAIPSILSGRDVIGVAKTGSGKTMAFTLPMFRHIKDQRPLSPLEGPIAMIMTPTRELANQIHRDCKPFLKAMGLRATCAYGGMPLKDNIADMKRGAEVVVCTPGRMIELLTTNSGRLMNLRRITYLVLDEADRMFDMGFEPQVMKIVNQIRPDRQTVMFSATFPRQMEALARKILIRPLEITVGGRSVVAPEIDQLVEVREETSKFNRLLELLGRLFNDTSDARALIFVERQESADNLLRELLKKNYSCLTLHGGMEQVDRDQTIRDFKSGAVPVVIATSVAARGLDVKQLKLVVNYDVPNHMEDYVHRAGRTGRAGNRGTCVTFVTPDQERYSLDIYKALQASDANIPSELRTMAEAFADKVKAGKASAAGSGFGGKGLERLEQDRDAASRAERAAYGEEGAPKQEEKKKEGETQQPGGLKADDINVEIRKGPAPDTSRPIRTFSLAGADKGGDKSGGGTPKAGGGASGLDRAKDVAANINAMLKAKVRDRFPEDFAPDRRRDPDATDYHAIIFINDYHQRARWKVTNKETMVQLIEDTQASITNKGVFYEPGKEPGPDDLPKLHLLIESNDEFRVKHAVSEIKRLLIEGSAAAMEAENRSAGPAGGGASHGRYNVLTQG